jgi:3-phenylpropionate/trans-cinnamate dioxygenase ferredoxin component
MAFRKVAEINEVKEGALFKVKVNSQHILLIKKNNEIYAFTDECTHDGGTLSDGKLDGYQIICPRHAARFDIRNGAALTMPATEDTETFTVRMNGGDIEIDI